jgi:hypothetical protein
VLQPELINLYLTSSLLPGHLPIVLRLLFRTVRSTFLLFRSYAVNGSLHSNWKRHSFFYIWLKYCGIFSIKLKSQRERIMPITDLDLCLFVYLLAVLELELRALCLPGRCSTARAKPLALLIQILMLTIEAWFVENIAKSVAKIYKNKNRVETRLISKIENWTIDD